MYWQQPGYKHKLNKCGYILNVYTSTLQCPVMHGSVCEEDRVRWPPQLKLQQVLWNKHVVLYAIKTFSRLYWDWELWIHCSLGQPHLKLVLVTSVNAFLMSWVHFRWVNSNFVVCLWWPAGACWRLHNSHLLCVWEVLCSFQGQAKHKLLPCSATSDLSNLH